MEHVCEKCNKSYCNKYTLKKHIESNICGNSSDILSCTSLRCSYQTNKKLDHQKHIKICHYIEAI
jgi:hypothetical protein